MNHTELSIVRFVMKATDSSNFIFASDLLRCRLYQQEKVGSRKANSSEYDGALGEVFEDHLKL